MNSRSLSFSTVALFAPMIFATLAMAAEAPAGRPSILVFIADDMGWRDSGAYGNDAIRTPNIDRLAHSGLRIERAFLTIPQCSPSRISILTGKYPHATGAEDLHMPLPEGERLIPAYLHAAGYFTGHMQKTHYGPNGEAQFQWYDEKTAEAFPAFLDAAGERPFFLWVGFHDPHRPYEPGAIPQPHDPARVKVPPYMADTPETRADLALYYDEIARMDGNIGRMLAELERRGRSASTLVVFLSDNGPPFPREKGTLYDGGIRTPLIFSWPQVIRPDTIYDRGMVSVIDLAPALLELAGLTPPETMQGRSLRGLLTAPASYQPPARVFSERNWHNTDEHMRSVRTERFKLIRTDAYTELPLGAAADIGASPSFLSLRRLAKEGRLSPARQQIFRAPRPSIELYDLAADPWELSNVADDPAYARDVRQLAAVLQEWIEQTGDFPPTARLRSDDTDRITGVKFTTRYPPMRHPEIPPPAQQRGMRTDDCPSRPLKP